MKQEIKDRIEMIRRGEVPEGHKKTKIGVIPRNWDVYKLSKVITNTRLGGNYSNTTDKTDKPLIKMGNLGRGRISLSDLHYIKHYENGNVNEYDLLWYGDLLFNTRNTLDLVGKVAIWKNELPKTYYNSNIMKIYFSEKFVESNFFMNYLFNSKFVLQQLKRIAIGTTSVAAIYNRDLLNLKLYLPTKREQQKIASILSTWDRAIELKEQLIGEKKKLKKGLMQNLLTPGFEGKWQSYMLKKLGFTFTGLTNKKSKDFGKGKPFIPYMNVFYNSQVDINNLEYVQVYEEKQNQVKYGDIIFTTSSEIQKEVGMTSVLLDDLDELYLNSFCFGFRLYDFDTLLPEFAKYFFRGEQFRKSIFKLSQGSTRFNLSKNEVLKITITIPGLEEQKRISQVMAKIDQVIQLLQQELHLLKQQKKGLMQLLLTGIVRVPEAETADEGGEAYGERQAIQRSEYQSETGH